MIPLSLSQLCAPLSAELVGEDLVVTQVSTDTRNIQSGALFIALKGARFDAHDFAQQAVDTGAAALLVERQLNIPVPQLVVTDTRQALGLLGKFVKSELSPISVAITGSAGKTTTKEMTAAILRQRGNVLATLGNFNNEIGVPLTLLRLQEEHQYAVMELGANHRGEIAYTSSLVKPDVALVLNVAPAHLEGFGSLFGVARAKGEIFGGLDATGTAVINIDCDYANYWMEHLPTDKVLRFSVLSEQSDLFASDIQLDDQGCASFTMHYGGQQQAITLTVPGQHNVSNALAAAAATLSVGCSLQDVAKGLASVASIKGRMNLIKLPGDIQLIDDSYNANLQSVKVGIDLLEQYPGQKMLVLGDMAELGRYAREMHQQVGEYLAGSEVQHLATLGELSHSASVSAGERGQHFTELGLLVTTILEKIKQKPGPWTVLVKGSRSARMERVIESLEAQLKHQAMVGGEQC